MPLTKLSSKGQLVLPKPIREALGLGPGTTFRVTVHHDKIILEPLPPSLIDRLYGKYAGEDFLRELEAEHRQEIRRETGP